MNFLIVNSFNSLCSFKQWTLTLWEKIAVRYWKCPIEIVDLPTQNGVLRLFSIVFVNVDQRLSHLIPTENSPILILLHSHDMSIQSHLGHHKYMPFPKNIPFLYGYSMIPSGKLTKNYGTSPLFMGKSTINGPFSVHLQTMPCRLQVLHPVVQGKATVVPGNWRRDRQLILELWVHSSWYPYISGWWF